MSTRKKSALASVALGVSAWIPAASGSSPVAIEDQVRYVPIQSISYDFGSKSTRGYFAQQDGACFVVLMLTENRDPNALQLSPTRVRLILPPGETAGLDSEEGRSLNFTCGEGAATLLVTQGDRGHLVELQLAEHLQTAARPQ